MCRYIDIQDGLLANASIYYLYYLFITHDYGILQYLVKTAIIDYFS